MTKEELEQKVESAQNLVDIESEKIKKIFADIVYKWVKDYGDNITIDSYYDDEVNVCLNLDKNCDKSYGIEFCIRRNWEIVDGKHISTKFLDIRQSNYSGTNDENIRKYFITYGKILEHFNEIESEVLSIDRTELKKLSDDLYDAQKELDDFKKNEENIHREDIKKEVEEKLIVGAKIITGSRRRWNENNEPYFQDIVQTVEKVMTKNIIFHNEFYRTKKTEVLEQFISGKWKWAE